MADSLRDMAASLRESDKPRKRQDVGDDLPMELLLCVRKWKRDDLFLWATDEVGLDSMSADKLSDLLRAGPALLHCLQQVLSARTPSKALEIVTERFGKDLELHELECVTFALRNFVKLFVSR